MKTGFFSDPIFLNHDTGDHPENAGRLEAIARQLQGGSLLEKLEVRSPRPATEGEISAIHSIDYIRSVEAAVSSGESYLGTPDCILSPQTYAVALNAAGALIDSAVDVAEGRLDNAFVACRPPGHHAEQGQAMGFCYFNNVAIAAAVLTEQMGYERVLIFDFDVHHGNGTQHSFEARQDILFSSIHQHPLTLYPGTGFAEEQGSGAGKGYTLNAPMAPNSGDAEYLAVFNQTLLPVFREYNPQFVLISAGFDAHRDDPLAMINLSRDAFDTMTGALKQLALDCCQGKLVSALEGGYNYAALSDCVASHLSILQGESAPAAP